MSTDQFDRIDDALALAGGSSVHRPRAERCNACHSYSTGLHIAIIDGYDVLMCPHPDACRKRAEGAKIWKTYNVSSGL